MTVQTTCLRKKAIIIGGSLSGLFTATILKSIGWNVDVYERSAADLDSRGGGMVLQADVVNVLRKVGATISGELGVSSKDRVVFDPQGKVLQRDKAPQTQTSWSLIYSNMRQHFEDKHYHQGKTLLNILQHKDSVSAFFDDGSEVNADIIIGADGGRSTVRKIVSPTSKTTYAGYVAYRGLINEKDMPEDAKALLGDFAFASNTRSHILGYLVPGDNNSNEEGSRYYNWVWYRAVEETTELPDLMTDNAGKQREHTMPPGMLAPKWRNKIYHDANALLPPAFKAAVLATEEPFAQAIVDLTSEKMVYDKVLLVGDAAFIPRPHTAASTAKAAANALALGESLAHVNSYDDLKNALRKWEKPQLRLGNYLYQQGSRAGNYLIFGG
ncbi:2-polyprenyl-6-methoxyphenol hydroxylase [Arsukibacterium sp. MJ3]|uniref:FAD binding domain-containing protein n=1 Tax=Arsukibacterium sp. MJ3 TaxID=1632859 RepID=UPI000627052E|nr:FAD-dependent monooxygenase [Arsukibacterium sp. MJ3]KKO50533.1 2-polyprenyl-6-methoxyphenol hydroxylase [Arsukibacterium sp. MJ3]